MTMTQRAGTGLAGTGFGTRAGECVRDFPGIVPLGSFSFYLCVSDSSRCGFLKVGGDLAPIRCAKKLHIWSWVPTTTQKPSANNASVRNPESRQALFISTEEDYPQAKEQGAVWSFVSSK